MKKIDRRVAKLNKSGHLVGTRLTEYLKRAAFALPLNVEFPTRPRETVKLTLVKASQSRSAVMLNFHDNGASAKMRPTLWISMSVYFPKASMSQHLGEVCGTKYFQIILFHDHFQTHRGDSILLIVILVDA